MDFGNKGVLLVKEIFGKCFGNISNHLQVFTFLQMIPVLWRFIFWMIY